MVLLDDRQSCLHFSGLRLHSLVCGPAEQDSDRCGPMMHLMSREWRGSPNLGSDFCFVK
jgi:hypothetical protein